ncbi:MFS transporter [Pedobacter miscanthi]|uniref:MFS transporter n=1 Tax=Pedobacter miscanthi TaxID=2259170 RepID=A0A366LC78_9SPHI|nr:MFS transporter [Pedobacter miscanthi]RBQ11488.1 MFS transporter [Pedobacter miscanthi]
MNADKAIQNTVSSLTNPAPSLSLVVILSLGTFIVFFQGFMVAPILPQLSSLFGVSVRHVSFIEPAYLLSYGFSTLIYAPLSDKYGRFPVIIFSISGFILMTACTGFAGTINQMMVLRLLTGLIAGGVAPTTIGWIGDSFPYQKRGHALGVFFGFMAGGTAFGSSSGALLTAFLGWQMLFWIVAVMGLLILAILLINYKKFGQQKSGNPFGFKNTIIAYKDIIVLPRGWRTYMFVLFNSMFHSGVFAWAGYFFFKNYHLSEKGVGLALLGYGIPGLLLGPFLGKLADKYGRNRIIPIGICVGAFSAFLFGMNLSLFFSGILVATLSLGFDMTHPLFAAIITTLSKQKGVAVGLFAFVMFMGYGLGSLVFSLIINIGLNESFKLFGFIAIIGAVVSAFTFKNVK